ncbi:MAG: efflux RND transporter periplasmic adaptor subunit [Polaromonas sp.]
MNQATAKSVIVVAIAVLAVAAGAYYVLSQKRQDSATPAQAAPKPALTVTAALPETTRLPIRLAANGNIAAWQEAVIGAESAGLRLTEVRVNVGDVVKAGQLLATFAADSVQADVAQARASLMEARANALDAVANGDRARALQNTGALSTQQINQYFTAEKSAQARVEAAQAVLDAQQLRRRQTQVLAPDSGVISARTATVGAVVGNGTELFRLIRQGRLEWRAEVTSAELGRIGVGTPVSVMPASGGELRGRVRMVAPSVDPQTRSALVYVDLPSAAGKASPAKAGMFARGEFDLGSSTSLTIPQRALVVRDGFNYVFRLGEGKRVSQLKVQTGRLAGERVEVVSGLPLDARIVVNGAGFLNHGDLVRLVEDKRPASGLAPAGPAPVAAK